MLINATNLDFLYTTLSAGYRDGFAGVTPMWDRVATMAPSGGRTQAYTWLGQFPLLREWLGERQVKSLEALAYTLTNKKFEATVSVPRDDIEDDVWQTYASLSKEYGRAAATHPDLEIFGKLQTGATDLCYDGQPFFSANHPVGIEGQTPIALASNIQTGSSPRWYLLDTTRALKPMLYQKRSDYQFVSKLDPQSSDHVFMTDEFLYGIRGRMAPGYGFWQMAFQSAAPVTAANVTAAYTAMTQLQSNEGRKLGLKPNLMLCGPSTYFAARALIKAQMINATSNTLYELVEVVNVPYLD